jgi:hypothetical protein
MTKSSLINKIIVNFDSKAGIKPTRRQMNEIINLLSMIMIEDPKVIVAVIENGIKFEKAWLKNFESNFKKDSGDLGVENLEQSLQIEAVRELQEPLIEEQKTE